MNRDLTDDSQATELERLRARLAEVEAERDALRRRQPLEMLSHSPELPDFRAIFEALPGQYMVVAPDLTIVAVSDELQRVTMIASEEAVGRFLFDVLPDSPDDPAGASAWRQSLAKVMATKQADVMPLTKYSVRRPESEGGGFVEKHWRPSNHPVLGSDGELLYIVHRTEDVTLKHHAEMALNAANEQIAEQRRELEVRTAFLENIIEHVPAAIAYLDRNLFWRVINPLFETISQNANREDWIGKYIFDTLPGTEEQVEPLLRGVLETGIAYQATDFRFVYLRDGEEVVSYWDFIYHPLVLDAAKGVEGILVLAHDTSKRVEQERERERHAQELQQEKERVEAEVAERTQELKAVNEKLAAQADELASQKAFAERILDSVPSGVAYLDRDLVFRFANPLYARFIQMHPEQIVGRYLDDVLPGAVEQTGPWLRDVMATGRPFENTSFVLKSTDQAGRPTETHWDFIYYPDEPDQAGQAKGVFVLANEISERLRAERERDEAQRERIKALEDTDKMKDQFLSILSHELRTPINAIMGFSSILDDELVGPLNEEQHRYARRILGGAENLLALINDLLDMSRIQAGKFALDPRPTDPKNLVTEVGENLKPLAEQKQQVLEVRVDEELPIVTADPQRVMQVLVNLVSNAIKFTPAGGRITVRARVDHTVLLFEVQDTGIGIESNDIPKLFKPFTQLDSSNTRSASGTGLGLSISKALTESHGGAIGVESQFGQGATFWFTLPLGASV